MRKNRHSLPEFQKFNKTVSAFPLQEKGTAGVILPFGESNWLDWSSDKDDII